MILISVFSDISVIMSQFGDKKDKDGKKSSSSKDKDTRLLSEMAKKLVAPNKEVIELLNKLGGRQAEVLRKEFYLGQAAMKEEVKSLAPVMVGIAKTLEGFKEIPSIPGCCFLLTC